MITKPRAMFYVLVAFAFIFILIISGLVYYFLWPYTNELVHVEYIQFDAAHDGKNLYIVNRNPIPFEYPRMKYVITTPEGGRQHGMCSCAVWQPGESIAVSMGWPQGPDKIVTIEFTGEMRGEIIQKGRHLVILRRSLALGLTSVNYSNSIPKLVDSELED